MQWLAEARFAPLDPSIPLGLIGGQTVQTLKARNLIA